MVHAVRNALAAMTLSWLAAAAGCGDGDAAPAPPVPLSLIPMPARVQPQRGQFRLADGARVVATDARGAAVARYFIDLMARTRSLQLEAAETGSGSIRLALDPGASASPEGYVLDVTSEGAEIRAADERGLFYGAVTLWQLATADGAAGGPAELPALLIEDAPRFRWRGLMLDSARHYQPPGFIKRLIDAMALHKLNVLHWHLTDDQGWRLEIRKYPALTETGARRMTAGADSRPYGGFYTQDEVRDLVAYAAARQVTIVPEIEMPGHAQAAIASYPRLGTGGAPPPVSPDWGVHDYLYNVDEPTFAFLEDVLTEVIALFPGEYIHVGGDEAVKTRWHSSPRVQARMRELGLADEAALQGWFVARIGRFLDAHGRRLIGWDEILEGGIPAGASVMSWRGTEGAIAAARAGHDVVMATAPTLYLDHLQGDAPDEPPGRPPVESLADVYAYEPVPAGLSAAEAAHVIGAQVNAWSEHMRLPERVERQAFPRVAALAEAAWSQASRRDWPAFQARLAVQFARYRGLGLHYSSSAFEPRFTMTPQAGGSSVRVALSRQAAQGDIRYTTDGGAPGPASARYSAPFDVPAGARVSAASYDGALPLSDAVAMKADAAAWRRRGGDALDQCSGNLVLRLEDDAPLDGPRALFNVDIVDPCWKWPDADLAQGTTLRASVGQLPFNFQIGKDADAIRRGDARTRAGELEVRAGDCVGEPIAVLPLGQAADNPRLSILGPARLPPRPAGTGLCLRFARPSIDPIWAIEWVELGD
jgi:hexosaminidase